MTETTNRWLFAAAVGLMFAISISILVYLHYQRNGFIRPQPVKEIKPDPRWST